MTLQSGGFGVIVVKQLVSQLSLIARRSVVLAADRGTQCLILGSLTRHTI